MNFLLYFLLRRLFVRMELTPDSISVSKGLIFRPSPFDFIPKLCSSGLTGPVFPKKGTASRDGTLFCYIPMVFPYRNTSFFFGSVKVCSSMATWDKNAGSSKYLACFVHFRTQA